MEQDQQSRQQRTRRRVLWTAGIVVALCVLYVLIRIGYTLPWTGFGQIETKGDVKPSKTLWDWLKLLIVPAVLAVGGYLFTRSESRATQAAAERQHRATQAAAERQAQEEALQAYLDQMSAMMIPSNDQPSLSDKDPPDNLKTVARARTLTVLPRLAGDGKGRVVQFLRESNLIPREVRDEQGEVVQEKVVDLTGADLRNALLFGLNLHEVALDGVNLERADLRHADLEDAALFHASLRDANLDNSQWHGADLTGADLLGASLRHAVLGAVRLIHPEKRILKISTLSEANLSNADLSDAILENADLSLARLLGTNLSGAYLSGANLSGADLWSADLRDANLSGADLFETVGWSEEQLDQAKSLDGATMPDGRVLKGDKTPDGPTFEEWRKSREGQG